jgi:ATP-dependent exoDNAse (exonuclease V) beta subunit
LRRRDHLTAEQRLAVERTDQVRTVRASAGAGKTSVLVETYLRHVLDEGARPDEILAITFTRKAASEMKRRIVAILRDSGLAEAAQIAETGPIQTIHGFCERLLRENALAAGVDPDFDVLPEHESARWREEALTEALVAPLDDQPEAARLIERLAGTTPRFGVQASLRARLAGAIQDWLRAMRGAGHDLEVLTRRYENAGNLWRDFVAAVHPEHPSDGREPPGPRDVAAALNSQSPRPHRRMTALSDEAESGALSEACGLAQIALDVWRILERRMEAEQRFDFTELEARAVRLVRRCEAVRERIGAAYKAVLIDEAQDVNPVQYRLLEALGAQTQMMVGDPQQAIYGFRLADRTLFDDRSRRTACDWLSTNFRSAPGILRFVDDLFARLWEDGYARMAPEDAPGIGYQGVELWRQRVQDTASVAASIRELIGELREEPEPMGARDVAVLVRTSRYAARLVEALRAQGVPYRLIGGTERFYTRMEVRDMANALRAVADPGDDYALLAVLRSPLAGLSLDAVALLGLETPVLERLGSFSSPLADDGPRLDRFCEWFTRLSAYADRLSAWEALAEVLRCSPYLDAIARRRDSDQRIANVRKLVALAAEERDLGPLAYAERIRTIQSLQHREGEAPVAEEDEDAVSVLTVHKAKGLEFPVVVVPDMYGDLNRRQAEVIVDRRSGLTATKFGPAQGLAHRWLAMRRQAEEEAEELRVLYVALTRAKRRLCVAVGDGTTKSTLAAKVGLLFPSGEAPPPGLRIRGGFGGDQPSE